MTVKELRDMLTQAHPDQEVRFVEVYGYRAPTNGWEITGMVYVSISDPVVLTNESKD